MYSMSRPLLIAFGNKARVGKDTAAAYLQQKHGGIILRFAEPIYQIAEIIQKYYDKEVVKDGGLLQTIGVGMREICWKNIWVDVVAKHIAENPGKNIFIPDMRFPNEFDTLKALGFTCVRINRKDRPIDRDPNHISEIALDDVDMDFEINNDGDKQEFYDRLDEIITASSLCTPSSRVVPTEVKCP